MYIKYQMTWLFNKDNKRQRSLCAEAIKRGKKRNERALVGMPAVSQSYACILVNTL